MKGLNELLHIHCDPFSRVRLNMIMGLLLYVLEFNLYVNSFYGLIYLMAGDRRKLHNEELHNLYS
jgi:hypothetical protein